MSNTKQVKKIIVGIPAYDTIKIHTTVSLLSVYKNSRYPVIIVFEPYTYIHVARTNILNTAVKYGATHLMFIDSDMMFSLDDFHKLVEADKNIIAGIYNKRIEPYLPVLYEKKGDELIQFPEEYKNLSTRYKNPFSVDVAGTGFMLINMNVFKKMTPPFFYHGKPEEFGLKKSPLYDLGEDTTFCLKAKKEGFFIHAHPEVKVGHVGVAIY